MIALRCQHCDRALKVKPDLAGKKVKCPGCAKVLVVPGPVVVVGEELRTLPPSAAPERSAEKPRERDRELTNPSLSQPDATATPEPKDEHDASLTDFLAPPQSDEELGRLGSFRILKILGHGGMGVVFMGEDPKLGRKVAIKAMLPHLAQSRSSQQRFLREAKTAAAIEHDHIVPILHVDEDRGSPFIVMPFLQGEPLDKRLARGKLPIADVVRIAKEIARGLAAAHKRGLIHRDIKPANVWLETRDQESEDRDQETATKQERSTSQLNPGFRVKILDFGLARAAAQDSGLTQQGAIIGTPAYMAPEQGRGEAVDARCDLWSLGVVLYRMLTGVQPFTGKDTVATLMSVAMHEPKPPHELNPEAPAALSDLTMRLLEKDPEKRLAKAEEVASILTQMERSQAGVDDNKTSLMAAGRAASRTVISERPTTGQMETRPAVMSERRRGILFGAIGLTLVGLVAMGAYLMTRPGHDNGSPIVGDNNKPRNEFVEAPQPPPRTNFALELTGTDRVEIASLSLPNEGPITLEAWVYRPKESTANLTAFLGIRKQMNFAFRSGGIIDCRFGPESTVAGGSVIPRERWIHIAAIWSNDVLAMFVNGKRTGANKAERPLPNADGSFVLTGGAKAAVRFAGVRLSNSARYDANFTPSKEFANDAHTLALYLCDEGGGNVLKDWSGNNRHGTIIGGTWVKKDDVPPIERGIPNAQFPKLLYEKKAFANDGLQSGADVAFSADGATLLAAGFDRANVGVGMRFYDPGTGTQLDAMKGTLTYRAAFSPEGDTLAATSRNELQLWHWPSKNSIEKLATKHIEPTALAFSPDGRWLVWGDTEPNEDAVLYWRDRKKPEGKPLTVTAGKYRANQAVFSADSRFLAAVSQNNRLAVFDASKCRLVFTRDVVGTPHSVSISSNAQLVAGFRKGKDGFEVVLFRIPSGDEEATFPMPAPGHVGPFFDGDAKMIATDNDGRIAILDVIGKKTLHSFQGHDSPLRAEAISPDEALLATLDRDGTLKVWQLKSRERAGDHALEFDGTQEVGVAFDGKLPAGLTAWTMEAFIWLPEKSKNGQLILGIRSRVTGAAKGPNLSVAPNGLVAGPAGTFPPTYGTRLHCAAVYDGKEVRLYVDGKMKHRKIAAIETPEEALTIAGHFKGTLDEIRFSKVARYGKDFVPLTYFRTDADTLALYHCDEGGGEVLTDASGNERHGKIVGGKWVKAR